MNMTMTIDTRCPRLAVGLTAACLALIAAAGFAQETGAGVRIPDLRFERTPLNTAVPEYPEDARRERLEGEATVCFSVDERGAVVRPKISSATDRVFRKPTLDAIRASTFRPLEPGALESPLPTCRTYRYTLNELEPLYVAEDSTAAEVPAPQSADSAAAGFAAAAPAPQLTPTAVAAAREDSAPASATLITAADPLPPAQPVCTKATRPGTRIEYTYCRTPEQQAEADEAAGTTVRSLQDETRFRDQAVEQALIQGSYPRGPGLGPR